MFGHVQRWHMPEPENEDARGWSKREDVVVGKVTSDRMDKTVVVSKRRQYTHKWYGSWARFTKYYAHDEDNSCRIGDTVLLTPEKEARRRSKLKCWKVSHILKRDDAHEFAVKANAIDRALRGVGVALPDELPAQCASPLPRDAVSLLQRDKRQVDAAKQRVARKGAEADPQ
ncbi:unnamed protein product [Pedinophyceae sp. YPF-701]|nr:unnamed protein product [Pedinophyceae sp. YPF-701]